jgi:hypothetical protein
VARCSARTSTNQAGIDTVRRAARVLGSPKARCPYTSVRVRSMRMARLRGLKPGGAMVPRAVTAWTALVDDRYFGEALEFLGGNPYGVRLDDLVEMTVNEIIYAGTFRHLTTDDRRGPGHNRGGTGAPRSRDAAARPRARLGQRARALVQRRTRARHLALHRTGRPADALGHDDRPVARARRAHPGNGDPGASQHRPGLTGRDLDELGDRAARL